jgi:hypothetical protein
MLKVVTSANGHAVASSSAAMSEPPRQRFQYICFATEPFEYNIDNILITLSSAAVITLLPGYRFIFTVIGFIGIAYYAIAL